jgi:RHS repeat-associated protein
LAINNLTHPTIDPNTNRFTTGQGYTYDFNGNLITDAQNRKFSFNGDNKQTEVRDSNNNIIGQYFYDAEGKRVKKVVPATNETTVFVYDGSGKLVAEYSTQQSQNPTTSYVATDTLQSVRAITNQNGEVISRRDFMSFGEELFAGTPNRTEALKYSLAGDGIRKKFTGYERDNETQLDFAEARYYNNQHGRFTAIDPLLASGKSANPQTFNRYVYVMNSPLRFTDPTGMQAGNYTGTVYYNKDTDEYSRTGGNGFVEYTGSVFTSDRSDGYRYRIGPNGWTQLGKTDDLLLAEKLFNNFQRRMSDIANQTARQLFAMGELSANFITQGTSNYVEANTPTFVSKIRGPDAVTFQWSVLAQGGSHTCDAYGNYYDSGPDFSPRVFFTTKGAADPLKKFKLSSGGGTAVKSIAMFAGTGFSINATWAWTKNAPKYEDSINIFEGSDVGVNYYHSIKGFPVGPGGGITVNPGIMKDERTILQTNLGIGTTGISPGVSRYSILRSRGGCWAWR